MRGGPSRTRTDPLDAGAEGESGINMIAPEDITLKSPPLAGVVLCYGQLYGPGTVSDRPSNSAPVHVDAPVHAALLAIDQVTSVFTTSRSPTDTLRAKRHAWRWVGFPNFRLPD
jgi:hypothetical protein